MDGFHGGRDRTFGVRVADKIDFWLWLDAGFEDFAIEAWVFEDAEENVLYVDGGIVRTDGTLSKRFVKIEHEIEFDGGANDVGFRRGFGFHLESHAGDLLDGVGVALGLAAAVAVAHGYKLGAITIGHRDSSIPLSYLDDKLQPVGFSIELCKHVVEAVKAKLAMHMVTWNTWKPWVIRPRACPLARPS